ncbi:MAG: flagellar hook-length control protein FliK [Gammaproteobacteria bacterium]|nr:flagellar hook-length control protein FliK [Gammaproteobacteria bacterium]
MWADAIVLVQQSIQTQVGTIQDLPKNLLANVVIGQRLEAVVMTSSLSAELASIKVADSLLEMRSPVALQAGQKVQLEVVLKNGEATLTLLPPVNKTEPVALKLGQQLAVEVIKVLAENRVLVQVQTLASNEINKSATHANVSNKPATAPIIPPQTFDIDVSKLSQGYTVGEKLVLDVVSLKPLNVQLRPEPAMPREQIILERIRQLLPQQLTSPSLDKVVASFQNQKLPDVIQKSVQQLIQNSVDKSDLTKGSGQVFKQAVASSGIVMERQLLAQPNQKTQDFKANLLNVLKAVETVISDNKGKISNQAINKLPAQVQEALATHGKTPTQLLNVLLSGKSVPSSLSSLTTQTTPPSIISQQQATSLVTLLTKPFIPSQQSVSQQVVSRHVPMDLIELMQLFKEVEGVHNKLQLNQLNMLKEAEPSSTVASWLFDIPIKDKQTLDLLQVQIDQHKQTSEDDDDTWNVKLRLDTQNLGPVQATVTLQNDDVKVIIRAERQESANLLADNLVLLNEAMAKLGVSISHSSCCCGAVDKAINLGVEPNNVTDSLLDVSV